MVSQTRKGEHLVGFPEVFRRIQSPSILRNPVAPSSSQTTRIKKLNEMLRNDFMHFSPRSQAIGMEGLPQIIMDAVAIIEHLVLKTPAGRRLKEEDLEDLKRTIAAIRRKLPAFRGVS